MNEKPIDGRITSTGQSWVWSRRIYLLLTVHPAQQPARYLRRPRPRASRRGGQPRKVPHLFVKRASRA